MTDHGVDKSWLQKGFSSTLGVSRKIIIFTDLDGTLLDVVYSYHAANEALHSIREQDIPLVICSSKTRAEIEFFDIDLFGRGFLFPPHPRKDRLGLFKALHCQIYMSFHHLCLSFKRAKEHHVNNLPLIETFCIPVDLYQSIGFYERKHQS